MFEEWVTLGSCAFTLSWMELGLEREGWEGDEENAEEAGVEMFAEVDLVFVEVSMGCVFSDQA